MTRYALIFLLGIIPFKTFAYEVPEQEAWRAFALSLINESRMKYGLQPVVTDPRLNTLSQNQAEDSALHYDDTTPESRRATYIRNESSGGKVVTERALDLKISNVLRIGENVGLRYSNVLTDLDMTLKENITALHTIMLSEKVNRDVILDPKYTHVGIGLEFHKKANAIPNTLFLVTDFAELSNINDSVKPLDKMSRISPSSRLRTAINQKNTFAGKIFTATQFRSMIMKNAGIRNLSRLRGKYTVILETSLGDITLELNADAAPKTVTNFIFLAKAKFYDHLIFHRVIPDFMIQGGDLHGDGTGRENIYGAVFADEINAESYNLQSRTLTDLSPNVHGLPADLNNLTVKAYYEAGGYHYNDRLRSLPLERGSIAMANAGPNTNGSQFFILQSESAYWLEGKHTVFGKVIKGIDIVDKIAGVARDSSDKPIMPVTFTVRVLEKPKEKSE